ncbi:MAG: caspase family protein, partial [Candidatus Poribacteria bacterium]|nr:caspase family protein [Candidatus Poribacteria bacterium]
MMKPKPTRLSVLLTVFLVTVAFAQREFRVESRPDGQRPENPGQQWALLVGIDRYDSERISPLRYCVADVSAFKQMLVDPAVGGFAPNQVYLMTNRDTGTTRPTNTNVIFRLKKIVEQVKPEDTFVFYFSGHGMTRDGKPFLLSVNADARDLDTLELSAIPVEKVKQILSSIKAHQTLFILDACRNDPSSGRGDEDNPLTQAFARGIQVRPKLRTAGLPSVTATLYACSLGERAYEWPEKQHGVFSYYLLEGLQGKAATPGGEVTVASLAEYTQQGVTQWAKENLSGGK